MKRKRSKRTYQKQNPPRYTIGVAFPRELFDGIVAIAAMERWSLSKTVVEIVKMMIKERRPRR